MKLPFIALSLAALLSLPVLACSSSDSSDPGSPDDSSETVDPDGKADGVTKPIGTYNLESPTEVGKADFAFIVLKNDNTLHVQYAPQCVTCKPAHYDGTYKFTKSTTSSRRYIKMELPNDTVRYEYKMKSGKLNLRQVDTSNWFTMAKAEEAWCAEPTDCGVQNLPQPKCPGEWQCEDQACHYSECSVPNPCESAGGSCVALYPGTCADGVIGDANDYSCGGGLGVQCCLPKPPPTNPCEDAGGMCVALTPGGCVNGTVGDANTYSCGGALGVQCCLPTPKDCRQTGCASGQYCTFCWSGYACIPEGAVC